jgi:hypothetical protein
MPRRPLKNARGVPDESGKHPILIHSVQDAVELRIGSEQVTLSLRQARLLAYSILSAVEDAQEPESGN